MIQENENIENIFQPVENPGLFDNLLLERIKDKKGYMVQKLVDIAKDFDDSAWNILVFQKLPASQVFDNVKQSLIFCNSTTYVNKIYNQENEEDNRYGYVVLQGNNLVVFLRGFQWQERVDKCRTLNKILSYFNDSYKIRIKDLRQQVTLLSNNKLKKFVFEMKNNKNWLDAFKKMAQLGDNLFFDAFNRPVFTFPAVNYNNAYPALALQSFEHKRMKQDLEQIIEFGTKFGELLNEKKIVGYFSKKYIQGKEFAKEEDIRTKVENAIRSWRTQLQNEFEQQSRYYTQSSIYLKQNDYYSPYNCMQQLINIQDIQAQEIGIDNGQQYTHLHVDSSWFDGQMVVGALGYKDNKKVLYRAYLVGNNGDNLKETSQIYNAIITHLKEKNPNLQSITGDFSKTLCGVVRTQNLMYWGCYFHYKQNIQSKQKIYQIQINNPKLWNLSRVWPFIQRKPLTQTLSRTLDQLKEEIIVSENDKRYWNYIQNQYANSELIKWFQNVIPTNNLSYLQYDEFKTRLTNSHLERRFKTINSLNWNKGVNKRKALIAAICQTMELDYRRQPNLNVEDFYTLNLYRFEYQDINKLRALLNSPVNKRLVLDQLIEYYLLLLPLLRIYNIIPILTI